MILMTPLKYGSPLDWREDLTHSFSHLNGGKEQHRESWKARHGFIVHGVNENVMIVMLSWDFFFSIWMHWLPPRMGSSLELVEGVSTGEFTYSLHL